MWEKGGKGGKSEKEWKIRKKGEMEKGVKEFDNKGKDRERVRKEKSAEKGLAKGKKTG